MTSLSTVALGPVYTRWASRLPGLPSFYQASLVFPCCFIKFVLFLMRRRAGPACQDPGCSSRDLGKLWANPWPSSRAPFTKFYGGRKQTSNDENFFLFLNIDEALRRPNYYLWHTSHSRFVNSARSFDMTNGTICFRQENIFKGNWWVFQHLGMKIGHTPPWNHRKKNYHSCILYDLKPK